MKNNIVALTIALALTACGGSDSSGDTGLSSSTPVEGSSDSSNSDCVVSSNTISVANGSSCDLTSSIVSEHELSSLSLAASSTVSCDANGALNINGGLFTSGDGVFLLNDLAIYCAG